MGQSNTKLVKPVRLDLNTAPFLNEAAIRRAFETAKFEELATYPEKDAPLLTNQLAEVLGVPQEAVLVGNGSDEILDLAARALVPPGGSLGILHPSFSSYEHIANSNRLKIVRVTAGKQLPVSKLVSTHADCWFLASPNNPTGTALTQEDLESLLNQLQAPILIDEAYAEFANQDFRQIAADSSRVIVTRTFSKAYGLPGIRVGYAVAPPRVIAKLREIKMPYNISTISEQVALAAISDNSFVSRVVTTVLSQRQFLFEKLSNDGWPVWPSQANFLLVGPLRDAAGVQAALRKQGILVKLIDYPGENLGQSLRITIGTEAQNALLLEALGRVVT